MKATYRLMGIADFITLANGLLGTAAIMFIILAVETLQNPMFEEGVNSNYIWWAMGCILLSVLGDIVDGPIARKYSKQKILGGTLDVMSDCISFCVAPALLMFVMFGRWGEASPLWSISLGLAACWIIVTGMLRLARFQHEEGSNKNYFHGLASPGNAMVLITFAALIWLQPSSGIGPGVSVECIFCFESANSNHQKPYFDFLILPIMFVSGALMISDRKLSKTKKGLPMRLSGLQLFAITSATIISINETTQVGIELGNSKLQFGLYLMSAILLIFYVAAGPSIAKRENPLDESE